MGVNIGSVIGVVAWAIIGIQSQPFLELSGFRAWDLGFKD